MQGAGAGAAAGAAAAVRQSPSGVSLADKRFRGMEAPFPRLKPRGTAALMRRVLAGIALTVSSLVACSSGEVDRAENGQGAQAVTDPSTICAQPHTGANTGYQAGG